MVMTIKIIPYKKNAYIMQLCESDMFRYDMDFAKPNVLAY